MKNFFFLFPKMRHFCTAKMVSAQEKVWSFFRFSTLKFVKKDV